MSMSGISDIVLCSGLEQVDKKFYAMYHILCNVLVLEI